MSFKIYNASAGSGKTFTLTVEYLKILFRSFDEHAYRKILAITFTNAAVKEMKERILNTLIAFTQNPIPEKYFPYYNQLENELRNENITIDIISKSKKIVKTLIHDYAAFDIMTIDKFTLRVIRTFANDLNLKSQFDVTLDTTSILKEAVDKVITNAGEDKILTETLINFAKSKADNDKSWNIENDIFEISKVILKDEFFDKINSMDFFSIEDFKKSKIKIEERIEIFKEEISNQAKEIWNDFIKNDFNEKDFQRGTFFNFIQKLSTSNIDFGKFEIKQISLNKTSTKHGILDSLLEKWEYILKEISQIVSKVNVYKLLLKEIVPISLINSVFAAYHSILEEQNLLSISDFNKIIYEQIKNEPVPFIYERLGDKYKHFFIDEFQDTSYLQWQNLIPLIDNSLVSMENNIPGSLMLVGDPKQAIYRFRGGKAEQFIELAKHEKAFSIAQNVLNLDTNFRSNENIIKFNNEFFKYIASQFNNEKYKYIYEIESFQNITEKKGGYVSIKFIDKKNSTFDTDEDENGNFTPYDQQVLDEILNRIEISRKQNFDYKDITILVRKREKSFLIAKYLNQKGIKVLSSESLLIKNSSDVQFILQFLNFIDNPENLEAKSKILYYIGKNIIKTNSIHQFLENNIFASKEEIESLLKNNQSFFSFSETRKKSLYDLVEYICFYFLKGKTTTSYMQHFIDLILEFDNKNQTSISDFLDYWEKIGSEKKIPATEGENAVQLMTIHKSKGLEFPIVIFPYADYDAHNNRFAKMWVDINDNSIELPELYLNRDKSFENYSDELKNKFQNDVEEDLLEVINLLYVALTRAEKQLHIISAAEFTKDGQFSKAQSIRKYFYDFVLSKNPDFDIENYFEFGNLQANEFSKNKENNILNIENVNERLNFESIKIAKKEALMWGTHQAEAIEYGNIIHKIMSWIKTKNDISEALDKSLFEGLISFEDQNHFKLKIESIIEHKDLKDFFQTNRNIYNEETIVTKTKHNLIPDRVEIENKNAYILDYKTGQVLENHIQQVNEYASALEDMGLKVVKKAIVYLGEDIKVIHL